MRRIVVVALALAVAWPVLGADPVIAPLSPPIIAPLPPLHFVTSEPAPAVYRKLVWEQRDAATSVVITQPVVGYFYTAAQVQKIGARIDYLEDRATKECIQETAKPVAKLAPWIAASVGVVAGVVTGYFVWRKR
jgi:hypothetical protein